MKRAMLMLMLFGCSYGDNQHFGTYAVEMCGEMPETPGWSAAFENDLVSMSRSDYATMSDTVRKLSDWSFCASHLE